MQRPILGASLYNADSQNTPDVSDIAGNVQSKRKSASIGDAYSLASASRSPSMFEDQHQFSSYLSPPGKLTIDPSLAREGSVSTAPEDDSPKQPVPEMSSAIGTPGSQRSARDHISAAQLSRIRDQSTTSYPSPADSGMDSPPFSSHAQTNHPPYHSQSNTQMPPPLPGTSASYLGVHRKSQEEISQLGDLALKRQRLSPSVESSDGGQRHYSTPYTAFSGSASTKTITSYHSPQPPFQSYSPSNGYGSIALTPTGSSVASEDNHSRANIKPSPYTKQESPDRRLSVSSLLSGPPGGDDSFADSGGESSFAITSYNGSQIRTQMINYGVDRGFPDLDLPTNNDAIALNGYTPATTNANYGRLGAEPTEEQYVSAEFGFGLHTAESAHEEQGYYEKPVTVSIPRSLGTLPPTLLENPMNLLYFHHFLNHTASILVPHDCSENPFKSILPESKQNE